MNDSLNIGTWMPRSVIYIYICIIYKYIFFLSQTIIFLRLNLEIMLFVCNDNFAKMILTAEHKTNDFL